MGWRIREGKNEEKYVKRRKEKRRVNEVVNVDVYIELMKMDVMVVVVVIVVVVVVVVSVVVVVVVAVVVVVVVVVVAAAAIL